MAVSKTKPVELLTECYNEGQRHFGENYVQEIVQKAPLLPADIQWHFIGHLQSKKCKPLLTAVPNLFVVEGVDSENLATKLDNACKALGREPLRIFIQVNTSGEDSKSGVSPDGCVALARFVSSSCPHLHLSGLMTIGKFGDKSPKYFEVVIAAFSHFCLMDLLVFVGVQAACHGRFRAGPFGTEHGNVRRL